MKIHVDIQHAVKEPSLISDDTFIQWVELALNEDKCANSELTLRLVDIEEITNLNSTYRNKNKATNVLAFPAEHNDLVELEYNLLGDIIICPDVLVKESSELGIPIIAHWAHIVIHGTLHLLGYDHIDDEDCKKMQTLEIKILAKLGFDNPYKVEESTVE